MEECMNGWYSFHLSWHFCKHFALVPFLFLSGSHSYARTHARTLTRSSAQFQQWHLFKSAGSSLFQYWVHINDDGCAHAIPHNGSSIIFLFCPCNEAGRLNAFLWSRRNAYMNVIRYSALVWSVYLFIYFFLSPLIHTFRYCVYANM